ncbi:MAG: hypothetical protein ABFD94_10005 [Armatimonadia bacterium]
MAFTRSADGIAKQGKTKGKNYGNSGPTVAIEHGPKKHTVGKKNTDMKSMGRGLAKIAAQKRG